MWFVFALGVGMRGVMRCVSACLPALTRTGLFDWKAVRSRYATRAPSEGDDGVVGGVCVFRCEGQLSHWALHEEWEDEER